MRADELDSMSALAAQVSLEAFYHSRHRTAGDEREGKTPEAECAPRGTGRYGWWRARSTRASCRACATSGTYIGDRHDIGPIYETDVPSYRNQKVAMTQGRVKGTLFFTRVFGLHCERR